MEQAQSTIGDARLVPGAPLQAVYWQSLQSVQLLQYCSAAHLGAFRLEVVNSQPAVLQLGLLQQPVRSLVVPIL